MGEVGDPDRLQTTMQLGVPPAMRLLAQAARTHEVPLVAPDAGAGEDEGAEENPAQHGDGAFHSAPIGKLAAEEKGMRGEGRIGQENDGAGKSLRWMCDLITAKSDFDFFVMLLSKRKRDS